MSASQKNPSVRRAFVWACPDQPWSRSLDRIKIPAPRFERPAGPRLRPFPGWGQSPAAPPRP